MPTSVPTNATGAKWSSACSWELWNGSDRVLYGYGTSVALSTPRHDGWTLRYNGLPVEIGQTRTTDHICLGACVKCLPPPPASKAKPWHAAVADEYADLRERKAALLAWAKQLAGPRWTGGVRADAATSTSATGTVPNVRPNPFAPSGPLASYSPTRDAPPCQCPICRWLKGQVTHRGLWEAAWAMGPSWSFLVCVLAVIWFAPGDSDFSVVGPVGVALALVVHGVQAAKTREAVEKWRREAIPPTSAVGLIGDFLTTKATQR